MHVNISSPSYFLCYYYYDSSGTYFILIIQQSIIAGIRPCNRHGSINILQKKGFSILKVLRCG